MHTKRQYGGLSGFGNRRGRAHSTPHLRPPPGHRALGPRHGNRRGADAQLKPEKSEVVGGFRSANGADWARGLMLTRRVNSLGAIEARIVIRRPQRQPTGVIRRAGRPAARVGLPQRAAGRKKGPATNAVKARIHDLLAADALGQRKNIRPRLRRPPHGGRRVGSFPKNIQDWLGFQVFRAPLDGTDFPPPEA